MLVTILLTVLTTLCIVGIALTAAYCWACYRMWTDS